jgi:RNA polymerase nonessential primary-like sigma factor
MKPRSKNKKNSHVDISLSTDPVRSYLQKIGKIPLLDVEEEVLYGQQVQEMIALLEAKEVLTESLQREPTLSEWANFTQLSLTELEKVCRLGERAKQKMVEANLRLVVNIAKKFQHRGLEFLDLIQEGTLGLQRGVEKFEPAKGYKFSTYAYWWIRQAITRAIADKSRTIRLPTHITEKLNRIKKTRRQLSQKLLRNPTVEELSAKLKMTPTEIRRYLEMENPCLSLEVRVGKDKDTEIQDLIADNRSTPEEFTFNSTLALALQELLTSLNEQEQRVISLRFGLVDSREWTLAEVARELNLSRERVRQIQNKALTTLRSGKENLKDYLE